MLKTSVTLSNMRIFVEVALLTTIIYSSLPLELDRLIILALASTALYFYTMYNSFNDGYEKALEDGVY